MTGEWWEYLVVFGASISICLVLTPVAMAVAVRNGVFDQPRDHKSHGSPVPYLGGVAIVVAFAAAVIGAAIIYPPESGVDELWVVLLLAVGLAFVGLADDLRNLSPVVRIAVEVLCAVQIWRMDAGVTLTGNQIVDLALTVLWVVGITNAFNLLDNMDGLAAGQAAVCAMTIFAVAAANDQFLVAALAIALAGCAVGFLRHNFYPARIYMGDGGALFIGFLIAYLGIKLRFEAQFLLPSAFESFLVPVLVCSLPIMDTTLVAISRLSTGRSPFQGGQDHFSHRLVKIGLPVPAVVMLTYVVSAGIGVLCFVISRVDPVSARILTGLIISTLLLVAVLLAMVPVYPESSRRHFEIGERSTDG